MAFMNAIKETLNNEFNVSVTENGAVGYRTSGKELLDLNFAVASLRNMSDAEVVKRFKKAFFEDQMLAIKWLFFARDARQGLGERRLFRVVMKDLVECNPEMVIPVINLIPEYGRYDDMWCLLDNKESADVIYKIVDKQLEEDLASMKKGKSISLLAKWMPSVKASSTQTKKYAKKIHKALGITEREYRKSMSMLRKYLDVVEIKMSEKNWSEIKYEAVPSRANLIYNNAFLRNDEARRREYLSKLEKGDTKINASVLYPHDIVHKYCNSGYYRSNLKKYDATVEALWKALPDTVQGCGNTIVVADGSGSMTCKVGGTQISALEVANALAIYFAEHSSGEFKDKYITFSENPQLVDFSNAKSLHQKLGIAFSHNEVANTNIEKTFDLILTTAINGNMKQEDIPQNVLVISDMEFDSATYTYSGRSYNRVDNRLFDKIAKKFENAGYKLPRLVFWNVNSRTGTIPVKENDMGVALVSGFSTNIVKMVMSNQTDPFECLLETLNSERYAPIEAALKG